MRNFLSIALLFLATITITSCEDLLECTGCDSATPWAPPDASACYATKADCETAEGVDCRICN